jgi:hypothetical protein
MVGSNCWPLLVFSFHIPRPCTSCMMSIKEYFPLSESSKKYLKIELRGPCRIIAKALPITPQSCPLRPSPRSKFPGSSGPSQGGNEHMQPGENRQVVSYIHSSSIYLQSRKTNHVSAEVFLLVFLKPFEILQYPSASVFNVFLRDLKCLFQLPNMVTRCSEKRKKNIRQNKINAICTCTRFSLVFPI